MLSDFRLSYFNIEMFFLNYFYLITTKDTTKKNQLKIKDSQHKKKRTLKCSFKRGHHHCQVDQRTLQNLCSTHPLLPLTGRGEPEAEPEPTQVAEAYLRKGAESQHFLGTAFTWQAENFGTIPECKEVRKEQPILSQALAWQKKKIK